ncbi:MAG: YqeG family HAD IIIA-type phosphatase [Bacilli bacterium]
MTKVNKGSPWQPSFYAPNLLEVTPAFFQAQGIKVICCDLDNTLAPYDELAPRKTVRQWVESLIQAGLTFYIISNNKDVRVKPFADALGVPYLAKTGKPFRNKLLIFLEEKGYPKDKVMVVGDQLLTDVWLANRLGYQSLFVEKLVAYDHWPTKPNRILESILKKRYHRLKRFHHWRTEK